MSDPVLPPEFFHPEWHVTYDNPAHNKNLTHANLNSTAESWAVWLKFKSDGNLSMGSGFFIDLPDLEGHKLILTAAHNLIDGKGKDTQDLEVFSKGNDNLKLEVVDTWCCPSYRANQSPEYDYAAIKVKHTAQISDCRGFVRHGPRRRRAAFRRCICHGIPQYDSTQTDNINGSLGGMLWKGKGNDRIPCCHRARYQRIMRLDRIRWLPYSHCNSVSDIPFR